MGKYRKKPVVIDAVQVRTLLTEAIESLPDWVLKARREEVILPAPTGLYVVTLEGRMLAGTDDWIIRGVKGELYPCKPDIFEATYEPADS